MNRDTPSQDHRVGRGMIWLAAIGFLAGLTYLFMLAAPGGGGQMESRDATGRVMVALQRDRSGHYLADGAINGQPVRFLVDTGATDVAISDTVARRLGLDFGPEVVLMTANGPARGWVTRIDSVSLGGLSRSNVRGTISPGLGEEALLGMSFLQHFNLRQEGETLLIAAGGATDA